MGIPIDPGDPINGGCPTCIPYMPWTLNAKLVTYNFLIFEGIIGKGFPGSSEFVGILHHPTLPPISLAVDFCNNPADQTYFTRTGGVSWYDDTGHCNLPFTTDEPPGGTLRIWE
jgi:hypothetical protein